MLAEASGVAWLASVSERAFQLSSSVSGAILHNHQIEACHRNRTPCSFRVTTTCASQMCIQWCDHTQILKRRKKRQDKKSRRIHRMPGVTPHRITHIKQINFQSTFTVLHNILVIHITLCPPCYLIQIFTHFKLCPPPATHNFKLANNTHVCLVWDRTLANPYSFPTTLLWSAIIHELQTIIVVIRWWVVKRLIYTVEKMPKLRRE